MHSIDIFVQNYISLIRTPFLNEVMFRITSIFDVSVYFILMITSVTLLVYLLRNLGNALLFFFSIIAGAITVDLLKSFFDISRPLDGLALSTGQSFPSFHATIATIFFVLLMYIFSDFFHGKTRILFNIVCSIFVILVGFSRLYLGVHWLSDVLGGIILGALLSALFITVFSHFFQKPHQTLP